MTAPRAIAVFGSLNMDFVVRVERLPAPGETLLGGDFRMIPGGKGANQACAAARLALPSTATTGPTPVRIAGRVGYDRFGDQLKAGLAAAGADVSHIHATRSAATGAALICVDAAGQNSIVVAPGANYAISPASLEGLRPVFRGARCALFQLEMPLAAVERALAIAQEEGATTILDPAPAPSSGQPGLSAGLLARVDLLTPNEGEALTLLGRPPARLSLYDAPAVAEALLAHGVGGVILKLGDQGCYYHDRERGLHVPAFPVEVVDSTAAGDTFNGALAVALAEMPASDRPAWERILRFACAAAALSVTRVGAQSSIPSRAEVDRLFASR